MSNIIIDTTKMSERGQVVLPKEIRDTMSLKEGTRFIVIATEDSIVLQKAEVVSGKLKAREVIQKAKSIMEKLSFRT